MPDLKTMPGGVVHDLPDDFRDALKQDPAALATWEDITPLARNEWICWIESAKKTRRGRSGSIGAARTCGMGKGGPAAGRDARIVETGRWLPRRRRTGTPC